MRRLAALLVLSGLLLAAAPAAAHAHVLVADGRYELTVGWRDEPAYLGEPNGLDLRVQRVAAGDEHHEGEAHAEGDDHGHAGDKVDVLGAHENLTVRYEYGGRTFEPLDLRPAFGRPGWYTAEITPTRPGVYTIRITGTIEGHAVNATVEPQEIDTLDEVSFPESDATVYELEERVAALEEQVAALQAEIRTQIEDPPPVHLTDGKDQPGLGLLAALGAVAVALAFRRRR